MLKFDFKGILTAMMLVLSFSLSSCRVEKEEVKEQDDPLVEEQTNQVKNYVNRVDTDSLIALYPDYTRIDLVCGEMPSPTDSSVIVTLAAAYTGECLTIFKHTNIAGDHISGGVKYKGYHCERNTGIFSYYNKKVKICKSDNVAEYSMAVNNGGALFAQELLICQGKILDTYRKNSNKNCFRALCLHNSKLCIIESKTIISLGEFKNALKSYGVSDAIYTDMGTGWNHAWYRNGEEIVVMHPKTHNYCTNWITFYR